MTYDSGTWCLQQQSLIIKMKIVTKSNSNTLKYLGEGLLYPTDEQLEKISFIPGTGTFILYTMLSEEALSVNYRITTIEMHMPE